MALFPSQITSFVIHPVAQFLHRFLVAAQLRRHTGHACAAEAVKDNVARVGVVQDVAHDGFMRHFGVVGMRVVDRVVLAFGNIRRKGFALVAFLFQPKFLANLFPFLLPLGNDLRQERVGAGGVIRAGQRAPGCLHPYQSGSPRWRGRRGL